MFSIQRINLYTIAVIPFHLQDSLARTILRSLYNSFKIPGMSQALRSRSDKMISLSIWVDALNHFSTFSHRQSFAASQLRCRHQDGERIFSKIGFFHKLMKWVPSGQGKLRYPNYPKLIVFWSLRLDTPSKWSMVMIFKYIFAPRLCLIQWCSCEATRLFGPRTLWKDSRFGVDHLSVPSGGLCFPGSKGHTIKASAN